VKHAREPIWRGIKAQPPRHRRAARRTAGAPLFVGSPPARRHDDLSRLGVPLGGFADVAGIKRWLDGRIDAPRPVDGAGAKRLSGSIAMQITREQRDAWAANPETDEWEAVIGPVYKTAEGVDVEALFRIADLNGLQDARERYGHLNTGQIAMNIRNRLRPIWRAGSLRLET
jgi:hypothetical protein